MTKRADKSEDLLQAVLKVGVCRACGADLALALAAVLAVEERVTSRCEQCGKGQEVRETARMSALLAFVTWLQHAMAAPRDEDTGDQVTAAGFLLLALAVARLAFAHTVEELRAHGGTALKNELTQAGAALMNAAEGLDESGCRRTLLLLGDVRDQELAHHTRTTLAFSAYQRYTKSLVEGVPVTTVAVEGTMASQQPGQELAQVYDELCAEAYLELRDAVCALCRAFLAHHHLLFQRRVDSGEIRV